MCSVTFRLHCLSSPASNRRPVADPNLWSDGARRHISSLHVQQMSLIPQRSLQLPLSTWGKHNGKAVPDIHHEVIQIQERVIKPKWKIICMILTFPSLAFAFISSNHQPPFPLLFHLAPINPPPFALLRHPSLLSPSRLSGWPDVGNFTTVDLFTFLQSWLCMNIYEGGILLRGIFLYGRLICVCVCAW